MQLKPAQRMRTRPTHERWLVSYADFITLLFAFFVVLFASSQQDQKKAARVAKSVEAAFQEWKGPYRSGALAPGQSPASVSAQPSQARITREMTLAEYQLLNNELARALATELARHEVILRRTPDGMIISLQELGFFETGSATLRGDSVATVGKIAAELKSWNCVIRIEGHTDSVPIHTDRFASNWELSTARATELAKLLVQGYGYQPESIAAGGYAEFHPVASNDTEEGRRKNRRVDLVIISATMNAGEVRSDQVQEPPR